MKNRRLLHVVLPMLLFLSCTYYQYNAFPLDRQACVNLSSKNYKIIGSATGYAEAPYVLFIAQDTQNLFQRANHSLTMRAHLIEHSRALINVTVDVSIVGFYPLYYTKVCYMSGDVIEFTNDSIDTDTK
jgi:hypothetical protein